MFGGYDAAGVGIGLSVTRLDPGAWGLTFSVAMRRARVTGRDRW